MSSLCESIWGGHLCLQSADHDGPHQCGEPTSGGPCHATWSDGQGHHR